MKAGTNLALDKTARCEGFPLCCCLRIAALSPVVSTDQDHLHCKSASVYTERLLSEVCLFNKSKSALKSGGDLCHRLFLEGFVSGVTPELFGNAVVSRVPCG